jgi:hypothetical protein
MIKLTNKVIQDLIAERQKQDCLYSYFEDSHKMTILTQQIGNVAEALLEGSGDNWLREELIELAVVAICWVEEIDK